MITWLVMIGAAVLAVLLADRAWLRHVARRDLPLHDPQGYLESIARMTELCHGQREQVDWLVQAQQRRHPQASHEQAVQLAMQQLLAPQASRR